MTSWLGRLFGAIRPAEVLGRLLGLRHRILGQLYFGLGGAVLITMTASLVAWISLHRVGDAQGIVNQSSLPEMAAAFSIAQRSSTLAAAAPRLTAAATREELESVRAGIARERQTFETSLAALAEGGRDRDFGFVAARGGDLIQNIDSIERSVIERFDLADRSSALRDELQGLQATLDGMLVPAIDDQYFYAMTGYREMGLPPIPARLISARARSATTAAWPRCSPTPPSPRS